MSVYNYDKLCKYSLGDLAHEVYFYAFNKPKIEYTMDSDDYQMNGICSSIEGNSIKMYCDRVAFTTETSSDNRYAFKNKLNIQLLERTDSANTNIIKFLLSNKLMVVFCDREGNKWILNPEFPLTINYSYNITDTNNNITSIDLISNSNIPPLVYLGNTNFSDIIRDKAKRYNVGKIKKLEIASIYDVFFKNNIGGFQIIEKGIGKRKNIHFDKGSLNFKEEYDGSDFKQTLTFNIPFKKYKSYFHIDLLEYVDNKYYALIKTSNDNLIIGGYRQGMFPEFSINTTEDNNSIAITLSAIYQNYNLLTTDSSESIRIDDITYDKIEGECIDNIFTYTLLQKRINGKITNDYYCLSGYENKYPTFNIVGTYSSNSNEFGKIKDFNINCSDKCDIQGLPTSIIFKEINEVKTFNISTDCKLTFEYDSTKVDVSFVNGVLTITNKIKKGDYNITVKLSDGTTRNIAVRADENAGSERTINITAKAQNVDIIASKGVNNVIRVDTTLPYSQNQSGNGYIVSVTENKDTINKRTFDITIIYNDGTQDIIHIIQDKLYKKIIYDGTNRCFGNDMFEMWVEKVGYTPDKIDISHGYIKGQLFEKNSALCIDYDEENVKGTLCVNKRLYNIIEFIKNGQVVATKLQLEGSECDDSTTKYEYRINREKATCINGTPYYLEELYASADGTNWYLVTPIIQRPTNEIATDSNVCEVIYPDKGKTIYRWYNGGDTYCLPEDKETNCEKVESITPKPGDINTYLCDGKDKWSIKAKYISALCDDNYQFVGYEKDKLIEENSSDCTQDINDDLAFEYSGSTPMIYTINNTTYTANQSPFSTNTKTDLGIDIITSMIGMFHQGGLNPNNITSITKIPDSSNVTYMQDMFLRCGSLTNVNISNLDTSKVTNMTNTFALCTSLTSLNLSNWNVSNVTEMGGIFSGCESLTDLDLSTWNTSKNTDMFGMFSSCKKLKTLDVSHFDTSKVTTMRQLFNECHSLTSLDLTKWNTSSLTSIYTMFSECHSLTSLDLSSFDTSNVIEMITTFYNCRSLQALDLSNWNIKAECNTGTMFGNCTSLTSITMNNCSCETINRVIDELTKANIRDNVTIYSNTGCAGTVPTPGEDDLAFEYSGDTAMTYNINGTQYTANQSPFSINTKNDLGINEITFMGNMFDQGINKVNNITRITKIPDTSKVFNMYRMFAGCKSLTALDLSTFDTSLVTNMEAMFNNCSSLIEIKGLNNFNTSKVRNMNGLFSRCSSLKSLDVSSFNTSNCTNMSALFGNCESLTTLDVSSFDTSNVTDMYGLFGYCKLLTEIKGLNNFNTSNVADMTMMFENCEKISSLNLSNFNTSKATNLLGIFRHCYSLTTLDLSKWDIKVECITSDMFEGCTLLTSITMNDCTCETINRVVDELTKANIRDNVTIYSNTGCSGTVDPSKPIEGDLAFEFSGSTPMKYTINNVEYNADKSPFSIDTKNDLGINNIIIIKNMFYQGSKIPNNITKISKLPNSSNVTDMQDMFRGCSSLTSLDLSNFNTSKVKFMSRLFDGCKSLTSLDLTSFDTSNVNGMKNLFYQCYLLSEIKGIEKFNTSNCNNLSYMFYSCESLPTLDLSNFNTSKVTDIRAMFYNCEKLTSLNLSSFDTSNVTNMSWMYFGCKLLTSLNLSNFNTSKVTDMRNMFSWCSNLTTLDLSNFNTSNVTSLYEMFSYSNKLISLDLSNFNTSKVTYMGNMFKKCSSLTTLDLSNWDVKLECITNTASMFGDCTSLTSITMNNCSCETIKFIQDILIADSITGVTIYSNTGCAGTVPSPTPGDGDLAFEYSGDTAMAYKINGTKYTADKSPFIINTKTDLGINTITDMSYMFGGGTNITAITKIPDSTNVTDMSGMFQNCENLSSLDLSMLDTSKVTDMKYMFTQCFLLSSLNLSNFNTSKVTTMQQMFFDCNSLTSLDVSSFDTSNVTDMRTMFSRCISLVEIKGLKNFNTSKVKYMFGMFENSEKITELDLSSFNTSNVIDMHTMFYNCRALTTLNLSNWDTSKINEMYSMFEKCVRLKTIIMDNCSCKTILDIQDELQVDNITGVTIYSNTGCAGTVPSPTPIKGDLAFEFIGDTPQNYYINSKKYTADKSPFSVDTKNDLGINEITSMSRMFFDAKVTKVIIIPNTNKVTDMSSMFLDCRSLIEIPQFFTNNVNNMASMFDGCVSIKNLNLSTFNTSKVTSMQQMFYACHKLSSLDLSNFDTSNVTNMYAMFDKCYQIYEIKGLNNFNTSKVTDMSQMFLNCKLLTSLDVSNFNTPNVTKMSSMFSGCEKIASLDVSNFNTSNVIYMRDMFEDCKSLTSLNLSNFNTSNVAEMGYMFSGCNSLTSLDLSNFTTSNVTDMGAMFASCYSLTSLDLSSFDTKNVTNMNDMFSACLELTTLNLSNWDIKATIDRGMFGSVSSYGDTRCKSLKTIIMKNCSQATINKIKVALNLSGILEEQVTIITQ